VRAAITGEAFIDACHGAVDLLARNLLDTVRRSPRPAPRAPCAAGGGRALCARRWLRPRPLRAPPLTLCRPLPRPPPPAPSRL
jgi:hypothetical protein